MFRSLMTIIRELYQYLTKVTFMLKHSVKLRRYVYIYILVYVAACPIAACRSTCCSKSYIHNDVILPSVLT